MSISINVLGQMPVGVHLPINLYNIDISYLETKDAGFELFDRIVKELSLNVVARDGYQFLPVGYTLAYILSESHINIHTYPEYKSCFIDIFCCNPEFNPEVAVKIIKDIFKTNSASYQIIYR